MSPALAGPVPDALRLPWHLGALHPVEQVLVLVLAFGPFLALGVVVLLRRRDELPDQRANQETGQRDR